MESAPATDVVVGLLAELFTWIGFAVGIAFGVAWLIALLVRSLWHEADAVVIGSEAQPRLRWIDEQDRLTERALEPWELEQLAGADHARVLFRGSRSHLKDTPHAARALGILAIVFLGLGAAAVVTSLVLMAVG